MGLLYLTLHGMLDTIRRLVVSSWPLYLQRKSPYQLMNMGLGEPHNRSLNFGKIKICSHGGESKQESSVVQTTLCTFKIAQAKD